MNREIISQETTRHGKALYAAMTILGELAQVDVPLGALTTYRVGGRAALLVSPMSETDLQLVAQVRKQTGLPILVFGNGSNMLVSDSGFPGIAVAMTQGFNSIDFDGATVRAGAGVSLPVLARRTASAGLGGFEWAVGVPGTVGGAVCMNAGGHGAELSDTLQLAKVIDLDSDAMTDRPLADLDLGYRSSNLSPSEVVVEATIGLAPGDKDESQARLSEIVRWRRERQPGGQNAGSCFANPEGDSAGKLIDAAGLKGFRIGSAYVHEKHANFVQCDEGGAAQDVFAVIREVRERVQAATGIGLRTEVRLVGDFGPEGVAPEGLGG